MEAITTVLVLLLAVLVSGILTRLAPVNLPLPMLQIAIGALLSAVIGFEVRLDPDIFFLLFIPPLLFLDGWRIPKGAFFRDWRPILTLAIGLVVFTVIGVGLLISQLIPAIPLAVAFALAAILSPTDPVAVSAITRGVPVPSRLMHILEGEALLNDASGLVCFRFAVAAALTGAFSFSEASAGFFLSAAGGLLAGAAVAWAASGAYYALGRQAGEEPGSQILISILIPFAAYLVAERLHASGILAAAAAGVSMHYADLMGRTLAATRLRRSAVWDMLQTALNGIIFVLLGQQLPGIFGQTPGIAAGVGGPWLLLAYVVLITIALAVTRFLWVWTSILIARFVAKLRGEVRPWPNLLLPCITALAGVRGAITLAGILTLPMVMPDGSPFPARDLAIFLAVSVILLSLVTASVGLPVLAGALVVSEPILPAGQEMDARTAAAEAAIRSVEQARDRASGRERDIMSEAATQVIDLYRRQIEYGHADAGAGEADRLKRLAAAERRFRTVALHAEREEYRRLRLQREIEDGLHRRLVREVDLLEASLSGAGQTNA